MNHNFMLGNGWGIVHDETGEHWVYIPLWDPIKFNEVGKALFATLVIKQNIGSITNAKAKGILTQVLREQANIVARGFSSAMDDDGWCGTPYPHHFHFGGGVIGGGDPEGPVYRAAGLIKESAELNAKAGITLLGRVLGNKAIIEAAELI